MATGSFLVSCSIVVCVLCCTHALPRMCRHYIRALSAAQNDFELPKITVVKPRCPVNEFIWYKARADHVVTFHHLPSAAFTLCLSRGDPGMKVYQLRGTSRKLLVGSNETGELGCFESECKHLSLYFAVDDSYNAFRIVYTYQSRTVNRCPQCTEVCQQYCFCTAQFVFAGVLRRSVQEENGLYTHYMKVTEFIKHSGLYNKHSAWMRATNSFLNTTLPIYSPVKPPSLCPHRSSDTCTNVPQYGLVKVYSKCQLTIANSYLISASVADVVVSSSLRRKHLVMCCSQLDQYHATYQLKELLLRKQCSLNN